MNPVVRDGSGKIPRSLSSQSFAVSVAGFRQRSPFTYLDCNGGRRAIFKLTVKLLGEDIIQPVEVADDAILPAVEKQKTLKSIPLGDVKVGYHVFGSGKLDQGVFLVREVLYVLVFEDKAAPQ